MNASDVMVMMMVKGVKKKSQEKRSPVNELKSVTSPVGSLTSASRLAAHHPRHQPVSSQRQVTTLTS